jgi:hypothetical protein
LPRKLTFPSVSTNVVHCEPEKILAIRIYSLTGVGILSKDPSFVNPPLPFLPQNYRVS